MPQQRVTVGQFYEAHGKSLDMRLVSPEAGMTRVIREPTVNRPGLLLAGFTKYFADKRIQVIGMAETNYLASLSVQLRRRRFEMMLDYKIPCLILSRGIKLDPDLAEIAVAKGVPVFRTPLITMRFINRATLALEDMFSPRITEQGSMVDIMGIGVLIKGESGIGKSECVLALVERGYSLVSDDVTRIRLHDNSELIGTSADITRNYMEVRGIGIIDVAALFGVKGIRGEKRIDLVISLKEWDSVEDIDRLGIEDRYIEILGIQVPHIVIPVRPGRDIARLVEVAAFHAKLKQTGVNPARELNAKLMASMNTVQELNAGQTPSPSQQSPSDSAPTGER
ncbi:MAG: HPr(Ser) kinase/phosphatase [Pedosphaera sp.]|nr:HPr(Ser) kinase/phosphatase [Pedosphaera sp.]